ncbi:aminomethyl-transferring glycine dehydrogenase subunit GcvPB [Wansuia hejianensis]|uniref:Probable glycine dehydrogenase (decarboxylating) subunit 2 n=1 Tax=Wansuia hejianensis TaxID=2763667 RepID=A0A926F403_9FIRM|nr:aminomethyl-transferring glycine dehydrogenase subunit GcvPB [Wansuia hejianensis]MBC8591547.1 aminomethyl-transferring glycine dehydrogenase subunit GcvPB [Wansuia hejianensis]
MRDYNKLIFELSKPGRKGYRLPPLDVEDKDISEYIPEEFINENELDLPEVTEVEVIRHYTNLSNKNYGLDTGFYPLGSCTMKYNPKINEDTSRLDGFANLHPLQREDCIQGSLQLMYELQESLCEIAGMDQMTLQPAAGAHGELTAIMVIKAYHEKNGDTQRDKIIVPDSAHGTNPATAVMAGYKIIEVKSTENGLVDVEALKAVVGDDTAGLMLTNPNTLGLFEKDIKEIAKIVHDAGGQLYYDGANANAILGHARPGDMGFDAVHFNIHKTFSTPHGGGGPGSGPVGVKEHLAEFLPVPVVAKDNQRYYLNYDYPNSIGKVKDFYGHFGILVRAYTYILTMGKDGLKKASEMAVLNANYLLSQLKDDYNLPIDGLYKHEFVLGGLKGDLLEATTLDVAKRLLDFGFHPPTVYFPLIIREALMIEPTETETKETLDAFAEALKTIAKESKEDIEMLKTAPHNTVVRRPDETKAARNPVLRYEG